jgi:VanZ family protein
MIEYAILCALFWQALGFRRPGWAWSLTVLYAASDEFHQTFVPGRHGWYGDLVVDATGALLAALALWRVRRPAR